MVTHSIQSWSDSTTAVTSRMLAASALASQQSSVGSRCRIFEELRIPRCLFSNLPNRTEGRLGEGVTATKMTLCRWLDPLLVARIEFLEWMPENRLRHPRFAGLRSDKAAHDVIRERGD